MLTQTHRHIDYTGETLVFWNETETKFKIQKLLHHGINIPEKARERNGI